MRMRNVFFVGLVTLLSAIPARGGLYIFSEPIPDPLPAVDKRFRLSILGTLIQPVSTDPDIKKSPFPKRVRQQVERLSYSFQEGLATIDDHINLGGYLCLQTQYTNAIGVLKAASLKAPKNAFVLSNLATAYQGAEDYRQAYLHLEQALKNWPAEAPPGWTRAQLDWIRRVEQFHLALLESRRQEHLRGLLRETGIDPIFPGVALDSPTRKFIPGEFDPQTRLRLPPDALAIVQQLLLWMPHDRRLMWLYGEMLNGHGDVKGAWQVIDKTLNWGLGHAHPELRSHARILAAAFNSTAPLSPELAHEYLYRLSPRVNLGLGGNAAAYEMARLEALAQARRVLNPLQGVGLDDKEGEKNQQAPTNAPPGDVLPNWKHIAIGFAAGVLVGVLLVLQLRQLFRRRPHPPGAASPHPQRGSDSLAGASGS